jgi:hypothetical protein
MPKHPRKVDIAQELSDGVVVYRNIRPDVLMITVDKAELCLRNHERALAGRTDWIAPFGILLTLICTFVTADHKEAFGISKHTWQAVYFIFLVASIFWLCWALLSRFSQRWRAWRRGTNGAIEDIIKEMKGSTPAIKLVIEQARLSEPADSPNTQS